MFDSAIYVLRIALLVAGGIFLVIAVLDWAVRTRRVNPFSAVARFCRRVIDPMLAPIETRVVRAGGIPSQAPWWGLAAVVVIGVLMIVALQWMRTAIISVSFAASQGGVGLAALIVESAFEVLKLALIVRVIVSWIGMRYSWWARALVHAHRLAREADRARAPALRDDGLLPAGGLSGALRRRDRRHEFHLPLTIVLLSRAPLRL